MITRDREVLAGIVHTTPRHPLSDPWVNLVTHMKCSRVCASMVYVIDSAHLFPA